MCIWSMPCIQLDHFTSSFSLTQWSWVTTRPVCYTLRGHWTGQICCRMSLPAKPSRRSTQTFLSCSLTLFLIPLTIHLLWPFYGSFLPFYGLFYSPIQTTLKLVKFYIMQDAQYGLYHRWSQLLFVWLKVYSHVPLFCKYLSSHFNRNTCNQKFCTRALFTIHTVLK